MNRREHIKKSAALAGGLCAWPARAASAAPDETNAAGTDDRQVMTVTGSVAPEALGTTLPHEHVASRFGVPPEQRPTYDVAALFETVVPALERIQKLGCDTVACATAAYFGRDALILKQLAQRTGVQIITNTGYYGAADDRYVPEHAYDERAEELAARWLEEWRDGVNKTGIRPGFIKTAVDDPEGDAPLSEIDRKLVRAAALTHRESGLPIAVHTGGNVAGARDELAILEEEGVAPEAWIWVHAQNVDDPSVLVDAAERGAWIELDNIEPDTVERHIQLVRRMKRRDLLGRVLLSHDGNTFPIEKWSPRPYDTLFTDFIPALREAGFSGAEVRRLVAENPQRAFTLRVQER